MKKVLHHFATTRYARCPTLQIKQDEFCLSSSSVLHSEAEHYGSSVFSKAMYAVFQKCIVKTGTAAEWLAPCIVQLAFMHVKVCDDAQPMSAVRCTFNSLRLTKTTANVNGTIEM